MPFLDDIFEQCISIAPPLSGEALKEWMASPVVQTPKKQRRLTAKAASTTLPRVSRGHGQPTTLVVVADEDILHRWKAYRARFPTWTASDLITRVVGWFKLSGLTIQEILPDDTHLLQGLPHWTRVGVFKCQYQPHLFRWYYEIMDQCLEYSRGASVYLVLRWFLLQSPDVTECVSPSEIDSYLTSKRMW